MKIVVLGYIVRGPLGGLAWHHFQYVLGLRQLGFDVLYLEDSDSFPGCYNPETSEVGWNPGYGVQFINNLFSAFDLGKQWAYFDEHTASWYGQEASTVSAFCSSAEIVLNLSAVNPVRDWWQNIPCRVYIDTDPGFTQVKHLTEPLSNKFAAAHTCYFSFGENINHHACSIPKDGFKWKQTRQPVFLKGWQISSPKPDAKWTTIMQWDSYKTRVYDGQTFGMKSLSFEPFLQLPQLIPSESFELALGSANAPASKLMGLGWKVISSLIPTRSSWSYQEYIQCSKAEWSVAKQGYVTSNSGWFSERSLCYMASGKPVLLQDTGFSKNLETGSGLLSFRTIEEVQEGIEKINKDYNSHCAKARRIVEENFDSDCVLKTLLANLV